MKSIDLRRLRLLALPLLMAPAACDDGAGPEDPDPVAAVIAVSGNGQTGPAGAPLPVALSVRLTTTAGEPVAGQQVRARIVAGGGSIDPAAGVTGADGMVSTSWTLGPVAGAEQRVLVEALSETGAVLLSAEATATAVPGAAASVVITPATVPAFTTAGRTVQLSAVVRDALGNAIPNAVVTWESADTLVASVSTTGLVTTRLKNGIAVIIARAGTAAGTVNIEQSRVPSSVQITLPANVRALRVGETMQLTATARDSANQAVQAGITWVSVTPSRATIDATGRLTAVGNGWAVIEAHVIAGVARDSVLIGPDASLVITALSPDALVVSEDSIDVRVRVQSTRVIEGVQATVGGVTRPLTAGANGEWSARFATAQLPEGALAIAVEARAGQGFFNTLSRTVTLARPVSLAITAPVAATTYNSSIPVAVTCSVASGPCASVNVSTSFGASVDGATAVNTTIAAPAGQHVVRITGRSAAGQVSTDSVTVTVIRPSQDVTAWLVEAGGNQSGLAGGQLATEIVVRALGSTGTGVDNLAVTVTPSAGTVEAPPYTDANGRLRIRWRLGNTPGTQKITLSAAGTAGPVTVEIFATAITGPAAQLTVVSGSGQTVATGQPTPQLLRVRVTDAVGNPVSGVSVTWQVLSGGGTITAASTSDDNGIATAQWTVGAPGPQSARASLAGLTATFTATAGTPSVPTRVGFSLDSLVFFTRARVQQITATVLDQYGNPMAGAVSLESGDPAIVTVSGSGEAQAAGDDGVAWIIGTSGALRDSVRVRVRRYPARFELHPVRNNRSSVPVGDSVRIHISALADSAGFPLNDAVLLYSSRDPSIATVTQDGWVRGISDGETTIDLSIEGTSATATRIIRVGPDPEIDIQVGTECVRNDLTFQCYTINPLTELVTVTVTYAPAQVETILVTIAGRPGTSTGGPVQVVTSDLPPGEYEMYVRVTMTNGRYNEVRGIAIIP